MHEYGTFVYLDVPKTGTSFICSLLRKYCAEKRLAHVHHGGIEGGKCDRSKLHFISIRDPYDQYVSLYSFGCRSQGKLRRRLKKRRLGDLYDGTWSGFRRWLEFVLDPENVGFLDPRYGKGELKRIGQLLGFLSYRVFLQAVPDAANLLAACTTQADIKAVFEAENVVDFIVRFESLRSDLAVLVGDRLKGSFSDSEAALRFIEMEPPRNTSDRVDGDRPGRSVGNRLLRLLREREWLMYDVFGYALLAGEASKCNSLESGS